MGLRGVTGPDIMISGFSYKFDIITLLIQNLSNLLNINITDARIIRKNSHFNPLTPDPPKSAK